MISRRHLLYAAPLVLAGAAGVSFFAMLGRMKTGAFDPHDIGSPMDGKKIPNFALPGVNQPAGFSSADVTAQKRPILINFFASWCVPCIEEMPTLITLSASVPIWGIAYQDKPADTARVLARYGNPYQRLAADSSGYTAIDFGLYGVPETYVIDKQGIIRARYPGPLGDDLINGRLMPLLRQLA